MRRMLALSAAVCLAWAGQARAQSFGVETHNTLMPASGAMAGTSIAQPQDITSGINGNVATLTQFSGTRFVFAGTWIEPTYNLRQTGPILGIISPFSAKAENQGIAAGNFGVTQDLHSLGLPATFGIGFISGAAGGADFRQAPGSNGTNSLINVFQISPGVALDLTDRLSLGTSLSLGLAQLDGPFVGLSGVSYDYALRGSVGLNYLVSPTTRFGMYYQTRQAFDFKNAVQLSLGGGAFSVTQDVAMGLPDNVGLGVSNTSLANGRLLLAADVLYKQWDNASLFNAVYTNQWVFQCGAQYTRGRGKLRLGYAYADSPLAPLPGVTVGGIQLPGLTAAAYYLQAQVAVANPHRITAGFGLENVLPGLDLDFLIGAMLRDGTELGPLTSTTLQSYWIGTGFTWRCRPSCRPSRR